MSTAFREPFPFLSGHYFIRPLSLLSVVFAPLRPGAFLSSSITSPHPDALTHAKATDPISKDLAPVQSTVQGGRGDVELRINGVERHNLSFPPSLPPDCFSPPVTLTRNNQYTYHFASSPLLRQSVLTSQRIPRHDLTSSHHQRIHALPVHAAGFG
ncbi:hypothetical protein Hypma_005390 [Hypsizygus marmoreus]|uniref:Uncharacterized protein n=1 Tax=Hypsizygus marmoreus TaxID=39966 RepID=A0A369JZS0_HYPMA|nr:hypothetical protein Hypma_005390 [Hypsizygus marmoreus]